MTMISPGIFIFAIFLYGLMTYAFKAAIFRKLKLDTIEKSHWTKGNELFLIASPDLWWAFRFKNKIANSDLEARALSRKKFVTHNNQFNLWFSLGFCLTTLTTVNSYPASYFSKLILCLAVIRFISRSIEITYAFVKDAFQPSSDTSATNLTSNERIKLAAKSYVEIYFFSAPPYLILTKCLDPWSAISLSLNVGTLTNVGLAFTDPCKALEANIVFFQVFTTLSLVVFSFAMYLARPKK